MNTNITFSNILKTVFPSIVMISFLSLYTIIDGAFVSKLVGTDALSAINIAFPYVNFLLGVSVMFASGGCAIIMKNVGEEKFEEAKQKFTFLILTSILISIAIMIVAYIFIDPIIRFLGATDELYTYCYQYMMCFIIFTIPTILKSIVEQFLVAINKSSIALCLTVIGGILNIVLDYIFIALLDFGIVGAGVATGLGYGVPAFIGILFFIDKKNMLHFTKIKKDLKFIRNACYNGSSEMVTQLSNGLMTFLFNITMLRLIGESGVAGITIILYVQFLVNAIFLGYSMGICPKISYFYGNEDKEAIKKINQISFTFIFIASIFAYISTTLASEFLVLMFTSRDNEVFEITVNGLKIFSTGFLLSGFNIFISSMFTAFENGKISALLSFLKILIFQSIGIIILSKIFGINGVWSAVPVSQVLGLIMSISFYKKYKNIYGY